MIPEPLDSSTWLEKSARLPRLAAGAIIVLILASVLMAGYFVELKRSAEVSSHANSGNRAWVVSQLEVDWTNFRLALLQASTDISGDPDAAAMAKIRKRFDIYYSRADVVGVTVRHLSPDAQTSQLLKDMFVKRNALAARIDAMIRPTKADLQALATITQAITIEIRAIAVAALHALVVEDQRSHDAQIAGVNKAAWLTAMIAALMISALVAVILLSNDMRRRAAKFHGLASKFEKVIEGSRDSIVLMGEDGRILHANDVACKTIQCCAHGDGEMINFAPDWLIDAIRQEEVLQGDDVLPQPVRHVITAIAPSGQTFPAELTVVVDYGFRRRKMLICFLRNISERIEAEVGLRLARDQAQLDASAKSNFLALMSHEMRTPLNGVIASLALMSGQEMSSEDQGLMEIARKCALTARAQIDDVLELTRANLELIEAERPIDPVKIAQDVVDQLRPLAAERDNELFLEVEGKAAGQVVLGQSRRYWRALYNLVGNAVKYTESGAISVRLIATPLPQGDVLLRTEVHDSGIGISPEDQKRIFNEFETLDISNSGGSGGTGLGLAIVQRSVVGMGGSVSVTSEVDEGSIFAFDITLKAIGPLSVLDGNKAEVASATVIPAESHGRRINVLVVDDNVFNRTLISRMVERLGYRADVAIDGYVAVRMAAAKAYDLIIMDIRMPGIDGVEATRRIRHGGSSATALIIGATAHAGEQDKRSMVAAGLDDVIIKPVTQQLMERHISSLAYGPRRKPAVATLNAGLDDGDFLNQARSLLGEAVHDRLLQDVLQETDAIVAAWHFDEERGGHRDGLTAALHRACGSAAIAGLPMLSSALSLAEQAARDSNDSPGNQFLRTIEAAVASERLKTSTA